MASIRVSEAARLTGKPYWTIYRAIKNGQLSFTIGPSGARFIDLVELERLYPIEADGNHVIAAAGVSGSTPQYLSSVVTAQERAIAVRRSNIEPRPCLSSEALDAYRASKGRRSRQLDRAVSPSIFLELMRYGLVGPNGRIVTKVNIPMQHDER